MDQQDIATSNHPWFLAALVKYAKLGPQAWIVCERTNDQDHLPGLLKGTWTVDGHVNYASFDESHVYGHFATEAEAHKALEYAHVNWSTNITAVLQAEAVLKQAVKNCQQGAIDMARALAQVLDEGRAS
ncbi:hypothetical protein CcrJ4_gp435 [Caulobacter phage J4]|nr:hypothetical protein CcrJ4_gp435 [Caulobacter phage J4]